MLQQNDTTQASKDVSIGEAILNRGKEEEEEKLQCIERDKEDEEEDDETFEGFIRSKVKRSGHTFLLRCNQDTQPTTERKPVFPKLAPFPSSCGIEKLSLLEALRNETVIADPDALYKKCCESAKCLREYGTLDKHILSDEEAAVLCATTKLAESGLDFNEMLQSSKEKALSTFAVLLLKSLRKLPQHRGTLYFGRGSNETLQERVKGQFLRRPFCFTSSSMAAIRDDISKFKFKEISSVEDCWGYDLSDFVCTEDCEQGYCKKYYYLFVS